jgi:hypothetical protein
MRPISSIAPAVRPIAAVLAAVLLAVLLVAVQAPASAQAAVRLVSHGRPATASSVQDASLSAANAVDRRPATRWASAASDAQWLQVDLGRQTTVSRIDLRWEAAYAKAYELQVSADGTTWTTLASTTTGTGGTTSTKVTGTGRYVRMLGLQRATPYGYSLWEFQVYGTPGVTASPTPTASGAPTASPTPTATPTASPTKGVHVTGTAGKWQLTVDGKPWLVEGVTYGPPASQAATYMPDIAAMGVNTIRTWGTDASSAQVFSAASANGIRVIAGLWLDHGVDYVNDTTYKTNTLASIRSTVATYRGNPGVLMWDVGNEVMLDQSETQRVAYAKYVEQVTQAIHAVDPDHPVTATDAWTGAWAYHQRYAPSLDLYAVNTYNGIAGVRQAWVSGGYTKPYVVTETGPAGSWEVQKDANGIPRQPSDTAAAQAYTDAWRAVTGHAGVALGATVFHYGVENDEAGVWLNLRTNGLKRLSYYAVEQAYRGSVDRNTPPVVRSLTASPSTGVAPGAPVMLTAPATDPDGDTITYQVFATSQYIDGNGAMQQLAATSTGTGTMRIAAPAKPGVWKIAVYALDGHGNVGIETTSVKVG